MKKLLALLFLVLLATNAFALRASVLEYDPFPAKAGGFLDLFIVIENNLDRDTDPITVEFEPKDSIRLSFGEAVTKDIGIIPLRKSAVVKFRIEITEDAPDGENIFRLNVFEGNLPRQFFDLSVEVENSFPNIEIGDIESEPRKILPDTDDVKITLTVLNIGDETAKNLKTTLILSDPLKFSDSFSDISLIGNLSADSSSQAVFFIDIPENADGGSYKAQLVAKYTLKDSINKEFLEKVIDFDIVVKPVPKFEIVSYETNPSELKAGDRGIKLKLKIKNIGQADAESVRIKIFQKSEQPFEFDKAFDFVAPKLKPGQTGEATLEFRIEDSANLQSYLLDIEIKSFVDDTVRTEEEVIEITVLNPRPEGPDLTLLIGGALVIVLVILFVFRRRIGKIAGRK